MPRIADDAGASTCGTARALASRPVPPARRGASSRCRWPPLALRHRTPDGPRDPRLSRLPARRASWCAPISAGTFEAVTRRLGVLHALTRSACRCGTARGDRALRRQVDDDVSARAGRPADAADLGRRGARRGARRSRRAHAQPAPLVLKPLFGSQGRGLVLVRHADDLPPPEAVAGVYYLQQLRRPRRAAVPRLPRLRLRRRGGRHDGRRGDGWITNVNHGGGARPLAVDRPRARPLWPSPRRRPSAPPSPASTSSPTPAAACSCSRSTPCRPGPACRRSRHSTSPRRSPKRCLAISTHAEAVSPRRIGAGRHADDGPRPRRDPRRLRRRLPRRARGAEARQRARLRRRPRHDGRRFRGERRGDAGAARRARRARRRARPRGVAATRDGGRPPTPISASCCLPRRSPRRRARPAICAPASARVLAGLTRRRRATPSRRSCWPRPAASARRASTTCAPGRQATAARGDARGRARATGSPGTTRTASRTSSTSALPALASARGGGRRRLWPTVARLSGASWRPSPTPMSRASTASRPPMRLRSEAVAAMRALAGRRRR